MSRKDVSRYFNRSLWSRMPLYKAVLALCCAVLLVVGTGAGIALTAVNAAANSGSSIGSSSAPLATATPDPTASPTPEPTATPEPIELELEVTAVQQTLGITVMDAQQNMPVIGEDFEVVVDYKAASSSSSSSSSSGKASSSTSTRTQKPTETYNIDPETGTLLLDGLPVGDYTVTLSEREGYIMPEAVTTKVKEKVVYKVDTEAVKDQIKDESEVGAGDIVTDGRYEYMAVIHADAETVGRYRETLPYDVVRCDSKAHIVRDNESGIKGFAVFEEIGSGDDEILAEATPSLIMYGCTDGKMTLSVSNPDLALYEGPSDEHFDEDGKRIERSIYGREWVDNPCATTYVTVTLNGEWTVTDRGGSDVTAKYENGRTELVFKTREAGTEEIILELKK